MNSINTLNSLRQDLKYNVDESYRIGSTRFFKGKILCYGVRIGIVRKIAKAHFKEVKNLEKNEIFALCEDLFKTDYHEEAITAIQWLVLMEKRLEKADLKILKQWLKKYINNWAKDDDFCTHIIGPFISRFPELIDEIKSWSGSKNLWVRRASAVSFITAIPKLLELNRGFKDIFEVSEELLHDHEDLVQKGYGWTLKVAADYDQKAVFEFVMNHKATMPRTALRYAIEKMPAELRSRAMEK